MDRQSGFHLATLDRGEPRERGTAQPVEEVSLKKEIVNAPGREFLRPWVASQGLDLLKVFRVADGQARVWTMASNFAPQEPVALAGAGQGN